MTTKDSKVTCGYCQNYVPMVSDLRGICRVIPGDKPNSRGKKVTHDMDANQCPKFDGLGVVKQMDVTQQAWGSGEDISSYRSSTVFETQEEEKGDRLVWEKHARDEKTKD